MNQSERAWDKPPAKLLLRFHQVLLPGPALVIAANAVDNTIKAMTRKKEASINLYKGYRVLLKRVI